MNIDHETLLSERKEFMELSGMKSNREYLEALLLFAHEAIDDGDYIEAKNAINKCIFFVYYKDEL